ncbi:MAG: CDP-glucose 4,6-dehydratase [Rhodobacteraceae bacterium]|nr:CDP-glucose 4,6-dehydratase [Paracoccaceae bacterium]
MEGLVLSGFWSGKNVLVTGHTGFKGAWLSLMLAGQGANLRGLSLAPEPNGLFLAADLADLIPGGLGDLRDRSAMAQVIGDFHPDIVFHLAAQPLVRQSYADPVETWGTNLTGTLNLLELLRGIGGPMTVVVITTDKVYAPSHTPIAFCETDPLGGHDPYSASKAAVEILVSSHRKSFLEQLGIKVVTARAGNVIGGGDWAQNRIIPDILRAISGSAPLHLRYPDAVRPWQHVLDPLAGYMLLAEKLDRAHDACLPPAVNFGPDPETDKSVVELVETARLAYGDADLTVTTDTANSGTWPETDRLSLSIELAGQTLGWSPRWGFEESVARTMEWYHRVQMGEAARTVTLDQIAAFETTI